MDIQRVYIDKITDFEGKEVAILGWLYNKRSSGKLQFLQVRDGHGIIQCVMFKKDVPIEMFEAASRCTQESSVEVHGIVRKDARSPIGVELDVTYFKIISLTDSYPITKKEHGNAFLMKHRHLWIRSKRQHAILKIRAIIVKAIRDFLDSNDFTLVDTPIFTPAACEGTTTLFETDYFGEKAYLTQSGQLYNEATVMAFEKTYCFGPTFRAEKSKTRRHLTEFWMVEPEMAFTDINECMNIEEDFVIYIIKQVIERGKQYLKILERDISALEKIEKPFPRIHYNDAVKKLQELGSDIKWGDDFGGDDETILTKQYDRPIFIHHYPSEIKAFYMKKDTEDPKYSLSADLLAPEGYGEIIGAGQREDDIELLTAEIKRHDLPMEAFNWYLDLRRYGSVPHSGFGLGLERTITWICGLHHLRETIAFPRMLDKIVL